MTPETTHLLAAYSRLLDAIHKDNTLNYEPRYWADGRYQKPTVGFGAPPSQKKFKNYGPKWNRKKGP